MSIMVPLSRINEKPGTINRTFVGEGVPEPSWDAVKLNIVCPIYGTLVELGFFENLENIIFIIKIVAGGAVGTLNQTGLPH